MKKPEQLYWDAIKPVARRCAPNVWFSRIENSVGDGIPDTVAMRKGEETFWLELKVNKFPKRKTTIVFDKRKLRQSQINWHIKCASMGGESYILAKIDNSHFIFEGADAGHLKTATIDDVYHLCIFHTPRLDDILKFLAHKEK